MLGDVVDLHTHLPGAVQAAHRWLSLYKWPSVNSFAFDGEAQDRSYAMRVVAETHESWRQLVLKGSDGGCPER
jgi:inorganic pyrophosphatase